jgi:fructose-bisphosphate aldolase class II
VAIHLDHGTTYEQILLGIRTGFTSMMLDGSMHPFDENVSRTRQAVEAARAVGLSVEGELGTIGTTDAEARYGAARIIYTDPDDAVRFVEQTGVDSLAIAIGTSHGLYPEGMKPELKLDLLQQVKAKVGVPLVLHGGSNNPDSEIAEAVKLGINKINISSDIKVAYHMKMRDVLIDLDLREPNMVQPACIAAMKEAAAKKIDLFDAAGKAALY